MIYKGKLSDLLSKVNSMSWDLWVYIEPNKDINSDLLCMVVDVNDAELGSDNFTPLEVERSGYVELMSIQDLQGIIKITEPSKIVFAIINYLKNDSYLL